MRNKSPGLFSGKYPKPTGTSVEVQDNATSAAESTYSMVLVTQITGPRAAFATTISNPSEALEETAAPKSAASEGAAVADSAAPERMVGFLGLAVAGFVAAIAVM